MKTSSQLAALALLLTTLHPPFTNGFAATTINVTNKFAYAANLGWVNWRGDTNNGAVIGEYACAGSIYSANVGWISLGNGAPTNGIQYQNVSSNDFGVNHDGDGNLRGYAYGANIGWIKFEATGAPAVNLGNGRLGGYAYSANCGWISLYDATAFVQTDTIPAGPDSDGDGLADAWERTYFSNLAVTANGDSDGDGVSNLNEYLAGTSPTNAADNLHITHYSRGGAFHAATYNVLVWTSQPNRYYAVQSTTNLATTPFSDFFTYEYFGLNNLGFDSDSNSEFYRIRAYRPLAP